MTKTGRVVGGIIAISGGGVYTYFFIIYLMGLFSDLPQWIQFFYTLAVCVLAIIGGLFLIQDRTIGGVLSLVAGLMVILGLVRVGTQWYLADCILMLTGGIIGLAIGSES